MYPGLHVVFNTVSEIVEWLFFFGFEERDDSDYFRCIYHNEVTGECPFYKSRPSVCRGYDCYNEEENRFFNRYIRRGWTNGRTALTAGTKSQTKGFKKIKG
jgi:Fe-S-cluster containining protein